MLCKMVFVTVDQRGKTGGNDVGPRTHCGPRDSLALPRACRVLVGTVRCPMRDAAALGISQRQTYDAAALGISQRQAYQTLNFKRDQNEDALDQVRQASVGVASTRKRAIANEGLVKWSMLS